MQDNLTINGYFCYQSILENIEQHCGKVLNHNEVNYDNN